MISSDEEDWSDSSTQDPALMAMGADSQLGHGTPDLEVLDDRQVVEESLIPGTALSPAPLQQLQLRGGCRRTPNNARHWRPLSRALPRRPLHGDQPPGHGFRNPITFGFLRPCKSQCLQCRALTQLRTCLTPLRKVRKLYLYFGLRRGCTWGHYSITWGLQHGGSGLQHY